MKIENFLFTFGVKLSSLHSFALDLTPQFSVATLGRGYGHYLRAASFPAIIFLSAKSVFNRGFFG
tara:strand:- start:67 stop:261 length:195 start_codon:yes stop_codon:yes gene_type:complete